MRGPRTGCLRALSHHASRAIPSENRERLQGLVRLLQQRLNAQLRYENCSASQRGVVMSSLVRLLGFTTLGCGCVTGHYREVATNREITYVEEKGTGCQHQTHRRNHTLTTSG